MIRKPINKPKKVCSERLLRANAPKQNPRNIK